MSAKLGALNILLSVDAAQLTAAMQKAGASTQYFVRDTKKAFAEASQSYDKFVKSVSKGLAFSFGSSGSAFFKNHAQQALQLADAFGQYSSRLKQATDSTAEYNAIAAQTELYHQLKKAIEDGDSASQHRITHQLEGLTAERAALEGGLQAYSQIVIL